MENKAKRIHQKQKFAIKQSKIAKIYGSNTKSVKQTSTSALTCGNRNCVMCGNPRKMFLELTIQEKSFNQTIKLIDD